MAYEPYNEPRGRDPEVSQRAADGLWLVWVWRPTAEALPDAPDGAPWIVHTKCWHLAKVFGSKPQAARWVQRWQERRKRL